MLTIIKLWKKLSYLGTNDVTSETRIFRIRLFNQLMMLAVVLSIILIGMLLIEDAHGMFIPSIIMGASYTFALWLNSKSLFQIAKHLVAITYLLLTVSAYLLSEGNTPYAMALYVFIAAVFFLMEKQRDYYIYTIGVIAVFGVALGYENIAKEIPLTFDNYSTLIYDLFFLISLIVILMLFKKESIIYQSALSSKQQQLNEAQNLANIGTWAYYPLINRMECSAALHALMQCDITGNVDFRKHFLTNFSKTHQDQLLDLLENEQTNKIEFTTQINFDNQQKWFNITGAKYIKDNEFRIYGVIQDITVNKEALNTAKKAEELRQLNEDLKVSNAELQQFAYVASHDLQEPLRMVGNFVQLLEEEYSEELGQEGKLYIDYAVNGVQRMSRLIDDLLQYSRVGRKEVSMRWVDVEEVIQNKITDMLSYIKEHKANIQLKNLDIKVLYEPNQLGIIFQNLIHNAIKFNKASVPLVILSASETDNYWQFSVSDNGIGIAPQNQHKIFEIFKRLHRKEVYQGTGIGLALVKRIIHRHKGNIWIESTIGQGTTFHFTIPKPINSPIKPDN